MNNDAQGHNTELTILLETAARVKVVEERLDRHLTETRDDLRMFRGDLGDIKKYLSEIQVSFADSINEARLDHIKDDRATNIKLYTLSGMISVIMAFLTSKFFR